MKIAIIGGTGSIGEGFALRWARKHEIIVCSREIDKAIKAAGDYTEILSRRKLFCCSIAGCTNESGIKAADIVVLSIPYKGVISFLKEIRHFFNDHIVISLVVPMKKNDWFEFTPPKQGSAALEIQKILPKTVKVVSAYHNVSAKKIVMNLTKDIKTLHPLDGGCLRSSYMIESLTPFLLNLAKRNGFSDLGVKFV